MGTHIGDHFANILSKGALLRVRQVVVRRSRSFAMRSKVKQGEGNSTPCNASQAFTAKKKCIGLIYFFSAPKF